MLILDPYDMTFDAVGVFGLDFWLLFKSALSYCDGLSSFQERDTNLEIFLAKNQYPQKKLLYFVKI